MVGGGSLVSSYLFWSKRFDFKWLGAIQNNSLYRFEVPNLSKRMAYKITPKLIPQIEFDKPTNTLIHASKNMRNGKNRNCTQLNPNGFACRWQNYGFYPARLLHPLNCPYTPCPVHYMPPKHHQRNQTILLKIYKNSAYAVHTGSRHRTVLFHSVACTFILFMNMNNEQRQNIL